MLNKKIKILMIGLCMNFLVNAEPLIIFAKINPKPEYFVLAKEAILGILERTLQEPGCRVFNVHTSSKEEMPTIYLYEIWENEEAYAYHHAQSYTLEIFEKYKNWLAQPVEINTLHLLT